MAELVIRLQKYIGESRFNWDTFEFEEATSAHDVRMMVEYAGYAGEPATSICLEIGTCFGGSTFEGREIYQYLQDLGLPIRTRILGFAASMATILILVGDECEMDASAQLLVHGPSGGTEGTVTDMQSGLKMLTNEHEALRDIYMARTGQPEEVFEEWMSKDTFFTAKEALAAGLDQEATDPMYDSDFADPEYDEGRQGEFADEFTEPDYEDAGQEYRPRKQK